MSEEKVEEVKTILVRVREGAGFNDSSFDTDLLVNMNLASYDLFQNGVINRPNIYTDTTIDELDPYQKNTEAIISYLMISAKLVVDPPQPSMVATYKDLLVKLLDRLCLEDGYTKSQEDVGGGEIG